jgi:hypothetical protein
MPIIGLGLHSPENKIAELAWDLSHPTFTLPSSLVELELETGGTWPWRIIKLLTVVKN